MASPRKRVDLFFIQGMTKRLQHRRRNAYRMVVCHVYHIGHLDVETKHGTDQEPHQQGRLFYGAKQNHSNLTRCRVSSKATLAHDGPPRPWSMLRVQRGKQREPSFRENTESRMIALVGRKQRTKRHAIDRWSFELHNKEKRPQVTGT